MKRTKIIYVRGIWLAFSLVLAVLMLGQNGSAQTPGKQAVPEFFGVYLWTDGTLKEIPDVNPEFKKLVASIDPRDEKALLDFMRRFFGICYAANQKPMFVLYHNLVKPEMFSLERVVGSPDGKIKRVAIRLGIAPIEGKNLMYRLIPREELTPGLYEFKTTGEFGTTGFFSCLAVNTTADQWLDSLKAETTSRVLNPPSVTPQPTTPPPADRQRASAQTTEEIPLPKYFGLYAVAGGKLLNVSGQPSTSTFQPTMVNVLLLEETTSSFGAGWGNVTSKALPELPADVQFLFYKVGAEKLVHLAYVRNVVTNFDRSGVLTQQHSRTANGWSLGDVPGMSKRMEWIKRDIVHTVDFLLKPVEGQSEMSLAVPASKLDPGVYILDRDTPFLFAVGPLSEAEAHQCVDVAHIRPSGDLSGVTNERFTKAACSASSGSASLPAALQPSVPVAASCADYSACLKSGSEALRSAQWDKSLAYFQKASSLEPNKPDAWGEIGRVYMASGRYEEVPAMWDKALQLGGTLEDQACHEHGFSTCGKGLFRISKKEVSFVDSKGQKIFAGAPSEVTERKVGIWGRRYPVPYFRLRIANKSYGMFYLPLGVTCRVSLTVDCPEPGLTQQSVFARYIDEAIGRIVAGEFANTEQSPTAKPACSDATDLGYSLRSEDGHVYRVKGIGPPGSKQVRVFLDETGLLVQDPSKLQKLARGAWTKELIVDRYDANSGSGSTGVKAALYTFSSLQGWQYATDLLARATVELLAAIVTGSVSVGARSTQFVWGVVEREFTDPKVALAHWVRAGLEQSLDDYTQMEGVMRGGGPPEFKLSELERIESLYTTASTLASVNEALGAALAPTTWQDEFTQYLGSAITELMKQPGLKTNATLTLSDVLKLQQYVAGTGQAFAAYKQSLDLALKVSQANQLTISEWANDAGRGCGQGTAGLATKQPLFAFANASGTALLSAMIDEGRMVPEVNQLDTAVCPSNAVLSIAFDSHQSRGPKDNGRDRSHNFDQREGYKFRVVQGKANEDGSCLITNHSFLLGKQFLSVENEAPPIPCDAQALSQLERKQKRGVYSCRQIAQLGTALRLLVAEFDRRGNDLLAAILVKTADRLIGYELPAKFDEQNVTGWRVADDGRIENTRFTSLFALQNESTGEIELGIQWEAEEGIFLMLLGSSGDRFQEVYKGYRYTMPI